MLTFAAAPIVGIAIGQLSDTRMSRVPLIMVVRVWVAFGRVAISLAPGFGIAAVISIAFGTFAGVVNAQAFAVLRDVINRDQEPREASVTSVVRTGYSFGRVIGPAIGAVAAAQLGYRAAIAASALVALAALVPLFSLRRLRRSPGREIDARVPGVDGVGHVTDGRSWGKRGLWMFAGANLLGLTAEAIRLTYLPILAVDRLGVPLGALGLLLALAPAVELAAMPAAGALADRWGLKPMLAVGFGFGIAGFVAFATSTSVAGLVAGQVLNACFIAIILGLGTTYATAAAPVRHGLRYLSVLRRPSPVGDYGRTSRRRQRRPDRSAWDVLGAGRALRGRRPALGHYPTAGRSRCAPSLTCTSSSSRPTSGGRVAWCPWADPLAVHRVGP